MATSTISQLAPAVGDRLQDPTFTFWNERFEVYAGLAEAMSELLLLVGRPTNYFNQLVTIEANTCFQPMPSGLLCITNINLNGSFLKKTSLHALDYTQSSWGSGWQSDRAPLCQRWAPLGLGMFIVHPAPLQPITAQITGVATPLSDTWPPSGTESIPFEKNLDQALELFAASYCTVKETGNEFVEGQKLYQQFLSIAKRYSTIQDRRDDLVFSQSFGTPTAPSVVSKR